MQQDYLIQLIMTQLQDSSKPNEKSADFIRKIVNIYALHLLKNGDIPTFFMKEIISDIEIEAIEIYRKKTYGYLSLEEYRKQNRIKKELC